MNSAVEPDDKKPHVIAQWYSGRMPPPFDRTTLSTSDTITNELIQSLHLYSEIADVCRQLLAKNGHANPSQSFKRVQAYIRQATSFYNSATNLHYRASPLLYYYSFMNLAKAVVFVNDPKLTGEKVHHGLRQDTSVASVRGSTIATSKSGVFAHLYKRTFGTDIANGTILKIPHLLGYASDVRSEFESFKIGVSRATPCKFSVVKYADEQKWRCLVAILRNWVSSEKWIDRIMKIEFERAWITANNIGEIIGKTFQLGAFTFWQTTRDYELKLNSSLPLEEMIANCAAALDKHYYVIPVEEEFLFFLSDHIMPSPKIYMNEMLAIYGIMFWLGSLVRYRPELLEGMLARKDAWLVESFIRSCPTMFLRYARNLLESKNLAFRMR